MFPDLETMDSHVGVHRTLEAAKGDAGGGRSRDRRRGRRGEGAQGSGRVWRGGVRGAAGAGRSNLEGRGGATRSMQGCRSLRVCSSISRPRGPGGGEDGADWGAGVRAANGGPALTHLTRFCAMSSMDSTSMIPPAHLPASLSPVVYCREESGSKKKCPPSLADPHAADVAQTET